MSESRPAGQNLETAVEAAVETARKMKQDRSRKRDTDIPTTLCAYRGLDPIAFVAPRVIDRDRMLAVARLMASGFGPDLLTCTFETFHSDLRESPITGEDWAPREMQLVAEQHDGREKGWVRDAIMVMVCNRAGDIAARTLPYRCHRGRLAWIDDDVVDRPIDFTGMVPESLAAAMAAPPIDVVLSRAGVTGADFGLDGEQQRAHVDCAVARLLMTDCILALGAGRGSERERIIRRSLPGGRVVRGRG